MLIFTGLDTLFPSLDGGRSFRWRKYTERVLARNGDRV